MNPPPEPLYRVCWRYRVEPPPGQPEAGEGQPMPRLDALLWAAWSNKSRPDIYHHAVPVPQENNSPVTA